ncbi:hypothetical protein F5Y17DRAFT_31045 [Xylariaceae sp. FL0594]|nr:hypothetical protein F5Y17DRAFT_31045 [Xylariaceae sp. FL0594]
MFESANSNFGLIAANLLTCPQLHAIRKGTYQLSQAASGRIPVYTCQVTPNLHSQLESLDGFMLDMPFVMFILYILLRHLQLVTVSLLALTLQVHFPVIILCNCYRIFHGKKLSLQLLCRCEDSQPALCTITSEESHQGNPLYVISKIRSVEIAFQSLGSHHRRLRWLVKKAYSPCREGVRARFNSPQTIGVSSDHHNRYNLSYF